MIRLVFPLLFLILSTGCSTIGGWFGDTDNSIPPAELQPITQAINIQQLWTTQVGSGAE